MRYEKTITISKEEADEITRYVTVEPTCEEECLDEDETFIHTAVFHDGIEVDVKCCGVQYREGEDEVNTAWTEAVLFKNGYEVCCSEPSEDYFGEWWFEYNGDEYIVFVEAAMC